MRSDINSFSTCPAGQEQHEEFAWPSEHPRRTSIQYDYRAPSGELFSTVAPTLEICRQRRDAWARKKDL